MSTSRDTEEVITITLSPESRYAFALMTTLRDVERLSDAIKGLKKADMHKDDVAALEALRTAAKDVVRRVDVAFECLEEIR